MAPDDTTGVVGIGDPPSGSTVTITHVMAGCKRNAEDARGLAPSSAIETTLPSGPTAIGVISARAAIETAATLRPVEMQHAAILNFVLGKCPVPRAFATLKGAATLSGDPGVKRG